MCLLCIEVRKQKMTNLELARAYLEFEVPDDHEEELAGVISENYDQNEIISEIENLDMMDFLKNMGGNDHV